MIVSQAQEARSVKRRLKMAGRDTQGSVPEQSLGLRPGSDGRLRRTEQPNLHRSGGGEDTGKRLPADVLLRSVMRTMAVNHLGGDLGWSQRWPESVADRLLSAPQPWMTRDSAKVANLISTKPLGRKKPL